MRTHRRPPNADPQTQTPRARVQLPEVERTESRGTVQDRMAPPGAPHDRPHLPGAGLPAGTEGPGTDRGVRRGHADRATLQPAHGNLLVPGKLAGRLVRTVRERFAEAFYAKQPAQEPMTCEQWGRRYTSYLWGHARDWHAAGGDPNGTRNLEDEHDRLYAAGELPVLGRRPPGYTGWASGSDNGGSSCHHDAAMLNAPPMMFNASRCSFVSSTSPDCTRASPASSTFNVSIIALTPEFSTIWLNISRMGISRSISVVIPHTPRPLLRPPRGPFWGEIRKVHAFRLFRVWILRQPPPHRGGPEI